MTLIKSISGIRGTIGGSTGDGLSPLDIVKFTAGYATWLQEYRGKQNCKVVVGRDARISGEMVSHLVVGTLLSLGCDVVNIGLASTPLTNFLQPCSNNRTVGFCSIFSTLVSELVFITLVKE